MTTALKRGWEGKPLPVIVNSRTSRFIGNVFPPPEATLDQIKLTGVSKAAEVVGCPPQSMTVDLLFPEGSTTVSEIHVTYYGDNGWCGGCVELKKEMSLMEKKISQMKKELDLTRARHNLAEMTALVYQQISFSYSGHKVNNYNDLCALRDKLRTTKGFDSELESAVVKWAADFLEEPSPSPENLGHAFKMLCRLKADRYSAFYHKPNLTDVQDAIDFLCLNSARISEKDKVYVKLYFRKFAEKVCEVDHDDDDLFGNI